LEKKIKKKRVGEERLRAFWKEVLRKT